MKEFYFLRRLATIELLISGLFLIGYFFVSANSKEPIFIIFWSMLFSGMLTFAGGFAAWLLYHVSTKPENIKK